MRPKIIACACIVSVVVVLMMAFGILAAAMRGDLFLGVVWTFVPPVGGSIVLYGLVLSLKSEG